MAKKNEGISLMTIRIPVSLRGDVERRAKKTKESLNETCVSLLRSGLVVAAGRDAVLALEAQEQVRTMPSSNADKS